MARFFSFKYIYISIVFAFLFGLAAASAQPKGALAPKEREIEDVPNDSVAPRIYLGMQYEELMAVFGQLKSYPENASLDFLRQREKKLRNLRDTAWLLVRFMEDPIQKKVAENKEKEAYRVKLLKEIKNMEASQKEFNADREKRLKALDELIKSSEEEEDTATSNTEDVNKEEEEEDDDDGWGELEEEETSSKNKSKKTAEQKAKEKQEQERLKKEQEKKKLEEKLKSKQLKAQEKFIKREQEFLEQSQEDSLKMADNLSFMQDSLAQFEAELKASEDSVEIMRKNLKPVKNLAYEIRKEWVKIYYKLEDVTKPLGKEAAAEFDAIVTDFLHFKYDEVIKALDNPDVLDRIKTLKNNIFYSKKNPNIDCKGGIGVFLNGLPEEEIKAVAGGDIGTFLRTGCVGYTVGLGEECNLVILKLPDEQIIAILRKKALKQEYDPNIRKMVVREGLNAFDAVKIIK
jgi:hypothetical protein